MTGPCLMRLTWFQSYFDIMWMCMTPAALTETTVVMHIYRTMVFTTGSPQFDHYASCKSVSIIFIEIFLINGCCNVGAITCRQLPHPERADATITHQRLGRERCGVRNVHRERSYWWVDDRFYVHSSTPPICQSFCIPLAHIMTIMTVYDIYDNSNHVRLKYYFL